MLDDRSVPNLANEANEANEANAPSVSDETIVKNTVANVDIDVLLGIKP